MVRLTGKASRSTKLRAVFSIHPESVTIVANAAKNIKTVADLKGKIVNIGNPGSGQRGNAEDLFAAAGIDVDTGSESRRHEGC